MRLFNALAAAPPPLITLCLSLLQAVAVSAEGNSGLIIEFTKNGTCDHRTQNGDVLSMHYRGTLQSDGSEFDSSFGRGVPFEFKLGAGRVIAGWDQGLLDMCAGDRRRLIIPPELGYGDRDMGAIPPSSTLIFDTELMAVNGVAPAPAAVPQPTNTAAADMAISTPPTIPTTDEAEAGGSEGGPKEGEPDENDGECKLLGPFALLVQAALGALALLSLVYKRWRETPRRPLKVWFFDVSKQVVGSVLLHLANIFMSMFSSGDFDMASKANNAPSSFVQDGRQPNPCSFYLLNLAIDTTIGIPILVLLLRIFHVAALYTLLANPPESLKSGNYGQPPRATWWLKQSIIYFFGLICMKLCVLLIFGLLPWIAWVGDWALRWTEGNEAIQITFVMFIFPLIMNAAQYYIIDSFIKDKDGTSGMDAEEEGERERLRRDSVDDEADDEEREGLVKGDLEEQVKSKALKEANPTPVPDYDPGRDGEGSRSSRDGDKKI